MYCLIFTQPHPSKPRNGIHVQVWEGDQATVAIMATGNPDLPCDWKAAETAVQTALSILQKGDSTHWPTLIERAFRAAQQSVNELFGICSGAKANLCVVVRTQDRIIGRNDGVASLSVAGFEITHRRFAMPIDSLAGILLLNSAHLGFADAAALSQLLDEQEDPQMAWSAQMQQLGVSVGEDLGVVYFR